MAEYAYRAKRGPTEVLDGMIEAADPDDAIEKLHAMGLFPIRIEEAKGGARKAAPEKKAQRVPSAPAAAAVEAPSVKKPLFSRVRSSEITLFGRQLSSLIRSGVPILRGLWIIAEQTQNPKFRAFLDKAHHDINNGRTFSEVLAEHPKLFPPVYVAMVRTGEDSGNLQEAMARVSDHRQRQEEILSRVRTAMAYPLLMAVTGFCTIVFMLTFVIPKLTKLFVSLGSRLPLPTRILMKVSAVFQSPAFWAGVAFVGLAAVMLVRLRGEQLRQVWSSVSLRLPFVRSFVLKTEMARFARTLELLIKSGLPILRAMEIATPVLNNRVLRRELEKSREELQGGGSLGQSLKASKRFPSFMTNLITVAEESGKLDEAMQEIASYYERETDEVIRVMTSLMEPLMILVMGLIVGFIVMAMMLPMFELNMIVK
jgi:general secretion pathway protein F